MIRKVFEAFLRDCKTRELSLFTIEFYRSQIEIFMKFCDDQGIKQMQNITPDTVRQYLLLLMERGHTPGGRHAKYRALRVFFLWWEKEEEPENWTNPIYKVGPPKVASEPIEPVTSEHVKALLGTCGTDFIGLRDQALILCLLDTGARMRELLALDISDVDDIGGAILIRKGKGAKPRTVFIGKKSRRALRSYLRRRNDSFPALWITRGAERFAPSSLQHMLARRARYAGIPAPSPHDFRRAFALNMLRAGVDVISIQRLLGHKGLDVLRVYLAQTSEDLHIAHEKGSPVDKIT